MKQPEGGDDLDEDDADVVIGHSRRQAPVFSMVRPLWQPSSSPEGLVLKL